MSKFKSLTIFMALLAFVFTLGLRAEDRKDGISTDSFKDVKPVERQYNPIWDDDDDDDDDDDEWPLP